MTVAIDREPTINPTKAKHEEFEMKTNSALPEPGEIFSSFKSLLLVLIHSLQFLPPTFLQFLQEVRR